MLCFIGVENNFAKNWIVNLDEITDKNLEISKITFGIFNEEVFLFFFLVILIIFCTGYYIMYFLLNLESIKVI
jgi:hypothetical protein